jgi:hypothetical protein
VVFGGLLWYAHSWIVAGCYSIPTETDEIRFYPKDLRLCNDHMISIPVSGQVFLLENLRNRILTFTADCRIYIYNVEEMGKIFVFFGPDLYFVSIFVLCEPDLMYF